MVMHRSPKRETMDEPVDGRKNTAFSKLQLKKLSLEQVLHIDEMLASIGEYGEVRLVIQHGELRYINRVQSYRAWKAGDASSEDSD